MAANPDTGVVQIHGKTYHTVAGRIATFRVEHPEYTIYTTLISADDERVVMKAAIKDGDNIISTGYAEEVRGSSNINSTSALENCETSAVGRALAFFGLAGTEIASADEVANAIGQQNEKSMYLSFARTTAANEENHDTLVAVRGFLAEENFDGAKEAWNEIDNDTKMDLWVATTKGGWFTPRERQQMKYWSNDFETSRKG